MKIDNSKIINKIKHKADLMQIDYNTDSHFMDWAQSLTGVRHLDEMSSKDLIKLYVLMSLGEYQHGITTEGADLYLHRALSAYISPRETEKVKEKMMKMYIKPDYKEDPRFVKLKQATKNIKSKINLKNIGGSYEK
jgi:hypothetical protein